MVVLRREDIPDPRYAHLSAGYAVIARFLREHREGKLLEGKALPEIVRAFETILASEDPKVALKALGLVHPKRGRPKRSPELKNHLDIACLVESKIREYRAQGLHKRKQRQVALLEVAEQTRIPLNTVRTHYDNHRHDAQNIAAMNRHFEQLAQELKVFQTRLVLPTRLEEVLKEMASSAQRVTSLDIFLSKFTKKNN